MKSIIRKITIFFFVFLILDNVIFAQERLKVGLLIMATGKYINFVPEFIDSAQKYFLKNHDVTYFVFTDDISFVYNNTINVYQERLAWPFATMMRFETYYKNKEQFDDMNYLFASDSDMLFVDEVGDEILSERVATLHPGFYLKKNLPYERNKISRAYIDPKEDKYYFAGGFYGGIKNEFIKLIRTNSDNIQDDLKKSYIAEWHDESHNNRYFIDNPPTKILSPSYCYPEDAHLPHLYDSYKNILSMPKKLIALAKKHSEYQATK